MSEVNAESAPVVEQSATNKELIRTLLAEAVKVDFPDNPPLDKDGHPKFSKIDEDLRFRPLNDMGNGQRLLKRHGEKLIYVENIGWCGWTGTHWSFDDGQRLAEKCAHETAAAMKKEMLAMIAAGPREDESAKDYRDRVEKFRKFANGSGNASRLAAMLQMAQTYVAKKHDDMDTHRFLVTVENGTLCLDDAANDENGYRLVRLKKHDPRDLIAKKMPVKYDKEADCPKFMNALNDIIPDRDVQNFIQRYYGYCLTGSAQEQVIVMLHGGGSNGKSLLMSFMSQMFGDYAKSVPIASLMAQDRKSGGSGASPDLARLPGARYVTASEPEVGERFSETFVKMISGEEAMTVRHLNQGFFEYFPQFKLCISFNNKPSVRAADDGFWRRVLLVPFEQKFVDADKLAENPGAKLKNKNLKLELMEEASGILNWMVDGYLLWRESGLKVPDKVRAATAEYRSESNQVMQFMQAWCEYGAGHEISSAKLYDAYHLWAKENAYEAYTKTFFGRKVSEDPKVKKTRGADRIYYQGIRLTADADAVVANSVPRQKMGFEGGDDG